MNTNINKYKALILNAFLFAQIVASNPAPSGERGDLVGSEVNYSAQSMGGDPFTFSFPSTNEITDKDLRYKIAEKQGVPKRWVKITQVHYCKDKRSVMFVISAPEPGVHRFISLQERVQLRVTERLPLRVDHADPRSRQALDEIAEIMADLCHNDGNLAAYDLRVPERVAEFVGNLPQWETYPHDPKLIFYIEYHLPRYLYVEDDGSWASLSISFGGLLELTTNNPLAKERLLGPITDEARCIHGDWRVHLHTCPCEEFPWHRYTFRKS